jgi:hypothetical protein
VTNRGPNREGVSDADRACYLQLLDRYRRRFPVRLYLHCLLRKYFHRLAHGQNVQNLSSGAAGLLRVRVQ